MTGLKTTCCKFVAILTVIVVADLVIVNLVDVLVEPGVDITVVGVIESRNGRCCVGMRLSGLVL